MYKDIISYKLSGNTTENQLLATSKKVVESWISKQKGFVKWEIHRTKKDDYIDIVYWESEKDAKNAEKEMTNIPNASEWFSCYKEGSISSENITKIGSFQ